jgi:hypothetical protein
MHALFRLLGVLLAAYLIQALHSGHAYARSGLFGRDLSRDAQPFGDWSAVLAYALLAAVLLLVFWCPDTVRE